MDPTLLLSAGQGVLGAIQSLVGNEKANRLFAQRQAYHTPEEIGKVLDASTNLASEGYDSGTLNFLLNSINRGYATNVGTALRLGANPNDLSSGFDSYIQDIMKVGAENHNLNMNNFSRYLDALNLVAANKAAEQKSQQDILKDQLQAASTEKASGIQNIFSAANALIGQYAAGEMGDLFKLPGSKTATATPGYTGGLSQAEIIRRALANKGTSNYGGVGLY